MLVAVCILLVLSIIWPIDTWVELMSDKDEAVVKLYSNLRIQPIPPIKLRNHTIQRLSKDIFVKENSKDPAYEHAHSYLYETLLEPQVQCSSTTFLFIGVISRPSSFKHREAYRETVLHPIVNGCIEEMRYLFILGNTNNYEVQQNIKEENKKYGDILQGNFTDSYQNLTYKTLFLINWSLQNCPAAQFTFKLDDDVFVVIEDVHRYLKLNSFNEHTILGSVFRGAKPNRDTSSKWHVKNFNGTEYPVYVSGTAYLLSESLLRPLFQSAMSLTFMRIEDVFVTGVSAKNTGLEISFLQFPGFTFYQSGLNPDQIDFKSKKSIHGVNTEQLQYLYDKMIMENSSRC